jgi:hypothetical protein
MPSSDPPPRAASATHRRWGTLTVFGPCYQEVPPSSSLSWVVPTATTAMQKPLTHEIQAPPPAPIAVRGQSPRLFTRGSRAARDRPRAGRQGIIRTRISTNWCRTINSALRSCELGLLTPADTDRLGQAPRIVRIGLIGPHRQHGLCGPDVEAHHRKSLGSQSMGQPRGGRSAFQATPGYVLLRGPEVEAAIRAGAKWRAPPSSGTTRTPAREKTRIMGRNARWVAR